MSEQKKALMLASVASMIDQFNMPNVELLQSLGYYVDVVADFTNPGNISNERADELIKRLESMNTRVIDIAIPRSLNPKVVMSAYKKVKELIIIEHYDLIHCHSPIGGAITRLAAKNERKNGTRVIYTAHGFHFYDGAPLKNWIVFYTVEKWLSKYTDVLITINKEDYKRATEKFKAKKTVYVPGIGVDTKKFGGKKCGYEIRTELGIKDTDIMLLSVGELNDNKNHEIVIRALAKLDEKPYYVIVGNGDKKEYLKELIAVLNLQEQVKLVGFRYDVTSFYDAADIFVSSCFQETLSLPLMEAMASGLPVVCSEICCNTDLIDEDGGFFIDPGSVESVIDGIRKILNANRRIMGSHNRENIKNLDLRTIEKAVSEVYGRGIATCLNGILEIAKKREELGIPRDAKLIISVGELSVRKNHRVVVEALNEINDPNLYYIIVGKGKHKKLLEDLDMTDRLKLLGYRTDVVDLLHSSDLFVFPSLQEGLPVALMEAMAAELPCVVSRIRGNTDLIENEELMFKATDFRDAKCTIKNAIENADIVEVGQKNSLIIQNFSIETVHEQMRDIYDAKC